MLAIAALLTFNFLFKKTRFGITSSFCIKILDNLVWLSGCCRTRSRPSSSVHLRQRHSTSSSCLACIRCSPLRGAVRYLARERSLLTSSPGLYQCLFCSFLVLFEGNAQLRSSIFWLHHHMLSRLCLISSGIGSLSLESV